MSGPDFSLTGTGDIIGFSIYLTFERRVDLLRDAVVVQFGFDV
jgi:hypothetical protein